MSDNDLIRRGDAIALFDAPNILEDLRAIPAADPLADPRVQALVEALEWYREQARLARLIHSEGDAGRHALQADGGKRAAAALAAFKGDEA
jgi:hypothetical protein